MLARALPPPCHAVEDKLVVSSTPGWTTAAISAAIRFQEQFFTSRVVTRTDLGTASAPDDAAATWATLDEAWHAAFEMAWEAVVTGSIGVGAVVSDRQGAIVAKERNRVSDIEAPAGRVAGSSVAHAEINALAGLPFRSRRDLVLTTTLTPCLQCAAVIRMGPIATVRVAGEDPLWRGCDDFGSLNERLARRIHLAKRTEERLDDLRELSVEQVCAQLRAELVEATAGRRRLTTGIGG
jgi:tRNA(Arg) A34 adenosine deaminase TadA